MLAGGFVESVTYGVDVMPGLPGAQEARSGRMINPKIRYVRMSVGTPEMQNAPPSGLELSGAANLLQT
jgi:hypothetical protein